MCIFQTDFCIPFQRMSDRSSVQSIQAVGQALASCPALADPAAMAADAQGLDLNLTISGESRRPRPLSSRLCLARPPTSSAAPATALQTWTWLRTMQ
jgi:hypothetical protein